MEPRAGLLASQVPQPEHVRAQRLFRLAVICVVHAAKYFYYDPRM